MARALAVTELGRAARTQAGIKVRQPLARLLVVGAPPLDPGLCDVVRDEMNVKDVDSAAPEAVLSVRLKPNYKVLGPRFEGNVNAVAAAIRNLAPETVAAGRAAGRWTLPTGEEVGTGEVEVEESAREGFVVLEAGGARVALDTRVTPELAREGLVREIVHRVQNLRKEEGLAVTDRIRLALGAGGPLREALEAHRGFVQTEVLAAVLEVTVPDPAAAQWDLDGETVSVRLTRETP
jgi:isoleucyl-tRNA synthetase